MLDQKLSTRAMMGSCLKEQPLECARLMVAGVERHLHARGVCSTSSINRNILHCGYTLYIVVKLMPIYCYNYMECSFIKINTNNYTIIYSASQGDVLCGAIGFSFGARQFSCSRVPWCGLRDHWFPL